jgi:hypothetical protein
VKLAQPIGVKADCLRTQFPNSKMDKTKDRFSVLKTYAKKLSHFFRRENDVRKPSPKEAQCGRNKNAVSVLRYFQLIRLIFSIANLFLDGQKYHYRVSSQGG